MFVLQFEGQSLESAMGSQNDKNKKGGSFDQVL
jgi:Na+-translocating ferredoxin:NAD+ oxidoreductase RnfG subunit